MIKALTALSLLAYSTTGAVTDMHVAIQQRLTDLREPEGKRMLGNSWFGVGAGSLLGIKAFNDRDATYTPELANYATCDIQITPHMYDSGSTGKGAILAYRELQQDAADNGYQVHGIVGPARSDAAKPMNIVSGIDKVPSVSYWATSDQFDSLHSNYPYFSRVIPADSAVAKAAAQLFNSYGHKNVGIAYLADAYGEAYKSAFVGFAGEIGITVQAEAFQYVDGDDTMIRTAVDNLYSAGVRVGIVILSAEFVPFFEYAKTLEGFTGEGTMWILSEGFMGSSVTGLTGDMKTVVDGMGTLLSQGGVPDVNPKFDAWAAAWAGLDGTAKATYVFDNYADIPCDEGYEDHVDGSTHAGSTLLSTPFKTSGTFFSSTADNIHDVATYAYDASITLGMAACDYVAAGGTLDENFDGPAMYEKLKELDFNSVTGNVRFDGTGSRLASTGSYIMWNHRSEPGATNPTTNICGSWTEAGSWAWVKVNDADEKAYRFSGNNPETQWEVPADKIVPYEEPNHLDKGLIVIGNILTVISFAISITMGVLTWKNKKHKVIRASQPMFLGMILFGCIVSSSTIIAMGSSADDGGSTTTLSDKLYYIKDSNGTDTNLRTHDGATSACMLVPALYSLGFVFSFAALFAKVYRIVKIFSNKKLSKVTIQFADMLKPIILMLLIDGAILIAWATDEEAKLLWVRTVTESDQYGQPESSVGMCSSLNPDKTMIYVSLILALHILTLVYGNVMCYKARNVGTAYSESKYVFMAMVSNMQILVLGIPILIMVAENPVTNYFIRTGIIFFNDCGVMLLIFIPKFQLVYFGTEEEANNATSANATSANSTSANATSANTSNNDNQDAFIESLKKQIEELEDELAAKNQ